MESDVSYWTIAALGKAYRERSLSPVAATRHLLDRIKRLDPILNSFITVTEADSIAQAQQAERELAGGRDRGPLHGVPIAIKDLADVAGVPTTFASRAGSPRHPQSDAALVRNLKEAGAVLLGKTNLLEYAYGAVHPDFGQTNNPWDPKRTSGGSSGGSVAAVAAGLAYAAVGTDTGGSIRIPAAYCGITGLKPTFGRVSLEGVQALSHSLDHAGPLARNCADAAILLGGMSGTRIDLPRVALGTLRFGIMHHDGAGRFMEPGIQRLFDHVVELLRAAGARVEPVVVTSLLHANDALVKIIEPEASLIHRDLLRDDPAGFSAITRGQIEAGFKIPAVDYLAALALQRQLKAEFRHAFTTFNAIISPSVPWVAPAEDPPIGGESGAGEMLYSGPYNVAGLPALNVPSGLTDEKLPGGLQIVTPWNADELALAIGVELEKRLPPLQCPLQ